MKQIEIYTDGSALGNPGKGGWGAILIFGNRGRELSGAVEHATNNQMELQAVIEAIKALNDECRIHLYSDSTYVVHAMNKGWLDKWMKNGWKTRTGDVKNKELWQELKWAIELGGHMIEWCKVKAHASNAFNNRVDELARTAAKTQKGVDEYVNV